MKSVYWTFEEQGEAYFAKQYTFPFVYEKVAAIHTQLCNISFPFILPLEQTKRSNVLIQKYVDGVPANYAYKKDRLQVGEMIRALHGTSKQIKWDQQVVTKPFVLLEKWQARLHRFQLQEEQLRYYLQRDFDWLVTTSEKALMNSRRVRLRNDASTLLHGDVAHHNFLLGERPVMIDFDLAYVGPSTDEWICFMHRVLPHVEFDVHSLLQEQPQLEMAADRLIYLTYPNELLREWLYLLQLPEKEREKLLQFIVPLTKRAKNNWRFLEKSVVRGV